MSMNLQALGPSEVISRANSLHLLICPNHFDTAHPDDVLGGRHDASAGQHVVAVECALYYNPLSLLLSGLEIRRTFRVNCVWVGSYNVWRLQCPRPIVQIYTIISQDMIRRSTSHTPLQHSTPLFPHNQHSGFIFIYIVFLTGFSQGHCY
jgi:hypothetical protein